MLTVSTNFGTREELEQAAIESGRTVVRDDPPAETATEPITEKKPEPKAPGEETPAVAEGEATPVAGAGEQEKQEPSQPASEPKARAGTFKSKAEKAQQLVDRLQQDLELERGSKTRLEQELAAAKIELSKHQKPAADPAPAAPPALVKPKRPTREQCDFDDAKYEQAMDAYEAEVDTYNAEVRKRDIQEALAAEKRAESEKRQQEEATRKQKEADEAFNAWVERKDAGAAKFSDWEEVFSALPPDADFPEGSAARLAVFESQNPADIMYYFAKDILDNNGKEFKRVLAMSPVAQVREIGRIEDRLVAQVPVTPAAAAPVAVPAPKPAEKAPVQPKPPAARMVDPIEPLGGGRAATAAKRSLQDLAELAAAGDPEARKEYFQRRAAREG